MPPAPRKTPRKGIAWAPSDDALLEAATASLPPRADGRPWSMAAVIRAGLRALPMASQKVRAVAASKETRLPGPEPRE